MGTTEGQLKYKVIYRLGLAFWNTFQTDRALVDLTEGPDALPPGRALDLGCGFGRNAIYLARHGWDVTGVDFMPKVIEQARQRVAAAGVPARVVPGDVTRLPELGIGDGYTLLIDFGCYHSIPFVRRDAYAASVTAVAAPGAKLWMWGLGDFPEVKMGMTGEEVQKRFSAWHLDSARAISQSELRSITRDMPTVLRPMRAFMTTSKFPGIWRFQLTHSASTLDSAA